MSEKTFKIVGNDISDGYHTFDELYEHRHALFMYLLATNGRSWKSKKHEDGSEFDGWFIAGTHLTTGQITYHLPMRLWDICPGEELDKGLTWDGHTSADVVKRIMDLFFREPIGGQ